MNKFLFIIFIFLIFSSCSKKPKTAYICAETIGVNPFILIYKYPYTRIIAPSKNWNWVNSGLSNYKDGEWVLIRDKNQSSFDSDYIIHNYEIPEFNNIEDAFYIPKKGKNVGKKYKLPLTNYRSQILNRNTEILQIYEYKHFWHLKYKELEQGIDLQGIEIRINLSKSFRCVEDKDIYKRWNSIKLGDLISEMDKEKKN